MSVNRVNKKIVQLLLLNLSRNLEDDIKIVEQEIYKLFMSQISSLKELCYYRYSHYSWGSTTFTIYPESKDCFKYLSKLSCHSNIYPEFFYQLSQICHNIQILNITIQDIISGRLADLISVQKNLRCLYIRAYCNLSEIVST